MSDVAVALLNLLGHLGPGWVLAILPLAIVCYRAPEIIRALRAPPARRRQRSPIP